MAFNSLIQSTFDELVKDIERGVKPWEMSWISGMPTNATTRKRYRGINVLMLMSEQGYRSFATAEWATYKQWKAVGAQVIKGETSSSVTMFRQLQDKKDETKSYPMMRMYSVFNAAQVTGYTPVNAGCDGARIDDIDAWLAEKGIDKHIVHGDKDPCYSPGSDKVHVLPASRFDSSENYYAALLHEVAHWTGHTSRCDRDLGGMFGTPRYAQEELVAELSAAFLLKHFNITPKDQASYLAGWLKKIEGGKAEALYQAAREASAVFDFLIPEEVVEEAEPEMQAA